VDLMPKFICYYDGWYLDWSTVVDAPVTFGVRSPEAYAEFYTDGPLTELPARMMRARRQGTSAQFRQTFEELVSFNRAGYRETHLTLDQIIQIYCVEQRNPREGEGVTINHDE
jgi:hypothetical protein